MHGKLLPGWGQHFTEHQRKSESVCRSDWENAKLPEKAWVRLSQNDTRCHGERQPPNCGTLEAAPNPAECWEQCQISQWSCSRWQKRESRPGVGRKRENVSHQPVWRAAGGRRYMSNLEDEQDTQQNERTAESREGWCSGRLVWRPQYDKTIELQLAGIKDHSQRSAWTLWPQERRKRREQFFKGKMLWIFRELKWEWSYRRKKFSSIVLTAQLGSCISSFTAGHEYFLFPNPSFTEFWTGKKSFLFLVSCKVSGREHSTSPLDL